MFFIIMKAHLLLTGSEYTYRKTMGHSRDGMLISTGLGWVSSCVSINESIWGGLRLQQRSHEALTTYLVGNSTFPIVHKDSRDAFSLSTVEWIVLLTLSFIILSRLGRGITQPSHNIMLLQIYHFCRSEMFTQSCCRYQKFSAPTLHGYRARPQLMSFTLAHLFQPSRA